MKLLNLHRILKRGEESLGERGERFAAKWLRKRGYQILERNLSLGGNEADIVALDPDGKTVAIVEVKTRMSGDMLPEYSITQAKRLQLAKFAARLQRRPDYRDRQFRFDVVAIVWPDNEKPEVTHYVGAFESPW